MNDLEFVGDYRNPQQLTARQRALGHDGTSDGEFTFDDFIDIINPLQHIPIVSTLYREITGDQISAHARIFGDVLFGGPTGLITAAANTLFEEVTGNDIGGTIVAALTGGDSGDEPQFAERETDVAAASAAPLPADGAASENVVSGAMAPPLETAAGPAAALPVEAARPGGKTASTLPEANLPPTGGPGMLTGEAALSALFQDLRGGTPMPSAEGPPARPLAGRTGEAEMKSYPLPPRPAQAAPPAMPNKTAVQPVPAASVAADAAAVHPLIFAQNSGEADIADRMMQALDKYAVMARERQQDKGRPEEETPWQSDPVIMNDDS